MRAIQCYASRASPLLIQLFPFPCFPFPFYDVKTLKASMVVGFSKPSEAELALDWLDVKIPHAFWTTLQTNGLIDPLAPIPLE
jgi:hypothetical protein